uniref:Large ribosomal subunit protein mL45 n=1 Tax=Kalanchoe fedtschenkoi TaxID=63787 RepID=A0A7N0TFG1_KALFE
MSFRRLLTVHKLYRSAPIQDSSFHLVGSCRSYSNALVDAPTSKFHSISSLYNGSKPCRWMPGGSSIIRCTMVASSLLSTTNTRSSSTQTQAPPQARSMGAVRLSVLSPGIIYEPYAPRQKLPFWKRWFTKSGWQQTKADIIIELKSAYAIAKLRKTGYSKQKFYVEAFDLYKEINIMLANGDKNSLRKAVTEKMFSTLKNEIKQREARWSAVHWELIEPAISIRTLRARLANWC